MKKRVKRSVGVDGGKSALQTFVHVRWHEEKAIYKSALWIYHVYAWENDVWLSEKPGINNSVMWEMPICDKHKKKPVCKKLYTGFFFLPRSMSELNIHFSCLFSLHLLLLLLLLCQLTSCRVLWTNWILILQLKKWQIVL